MIKWLFLIIIVGTVIFFSSVYFGFWGRIPDTEELAKIEHSSASILLDINGKKLGSYFIVDRTPVTYEDLPQHLVDALVATEDARFYDHQGIDYLSLIRVFVKTILLQNKAGGGSTLSQQIAKNLYPRKYHSNFGLLSTKIKETIISVRLEKIYTKQQILVLYFNTVTFPDNTFGVQSASQKFFNKNTNELSLSEGALLIGTLKANTTYNPRLFPKRSLLRRNVVIGQLLKYGYIDKEIAESAMEESLNIDYVPNFAEDGVAAYFREQVRKELTEWIKNHSIFLGACFNNSFQ